MKATWILAAAAAFLSAGAQAQANAISIYFESGSAKVTSIAGEIAVLAAEETRRCATLGEVRVVGHVDASEAATAATQGLGFTRATAVRTALIAQGVPASAITIRDALFTEPALPTQARVREPLNRRTTIDVVCR